MSSSSSAQAQAPTCYQRWKCDRCHAEGTVSFPANADAGEITASALEQHAIRDPECGGPLRFQAIERHAAAL